MSLTYSCIRAGVYSFLLAALVVCIAPTAWGQATSAGSVSGLVTDQSGAAIPGAQVRMTERSTSTALTTTTNDSGRYAFINVDHGTYDLTITKEGFSQEKIQQQTVDVGQSLTLNATLAVGSSTTVVEVKAEAAAELQTLNATVGTTITNDQLNLLPNLGRDASTLSVLQVGVSLAGNVAGAATDQNGFGLDGGNNSDDMAGTNATYTAANGYQGAGATGGTPTGVIPTPIESIEEFKVGTTGQTADFNSAGGSQIQMITKRGTNDLHGALYEYYFGSNVGAANLWRNNHTLVNGQATPLPATHRNRFGAAVGGPIAPKFLGGKTYAFFNYEGSRFPNVTSFDHGTPTTLMRAGVLVLPNTAGVNTPYNMNPFPVTVNGVTYQPAMCGTGPCDPRGLGVNPLIQRLWGTMPLPNDATFTGNGSATTGYLDGLNTQGYLGNLSLPQTSNFMVGRIDHDFSDKWRFMASYRYYSFSQLVSTQVDVGGLLSGATQGQYKSFAPRPVKPSYWVAGLTTQITPNLSNDFRFSFLRNFWQWSTQSGPPQFAGLGGAIEVGGENQTGSLIPYNVDSQDVRQRFWDGHDYFLSNNQSLLKGNHLFQYGGSYMRQFLFHGRDDNGVGINTSIVYQVGGTNINNAAYTLPNGAAASALGSGYPLMYNELFGIVNQTQVMYSRSGANLQLNPLHTPGFDQSVVPTYDLYFSDTWHLRPSLTLTYGLGYGLAMPAYEINGKQVLMVDGAGNPIDIKSYMLSRQAAALQGQSYTPQIGFETIRNINGGTVKYPYQPFYGGFSPRAALAWSPNFDNGILGALVGRNKTVIRGGYGRIYGRLNGVDLMLVPLLGPGLLQAVSCPAPQINGTCGNSTPANAFRIGVDGMSAPLPSVTNTLPQPFYPGITQNGILNSPSADGSGLDPKLRPNHSDEFNFTIQRTVGSKMVMEAGYIGRRIRNEFQEINLDAVPWMMTLNGQSFAQAYAAVYNQICPPGPICAATATSAVTAQPFFEAALGGPNSPYCTGSSSCTAAVVKNEVANLRTTKAYSTWYDISQATSWTLGRTLLRTPGAGQALSGAFDFINSYGFGNYNAAFFSFSAHDWHGLTARSNFTWGRALGTGSVTQSSSSITVPNPYDFNGGFGTYGVQPFDVKFTYSLLMLYQPPFFRSQKGIAGHILGGWTIAPLFTARSGLPQRMSTSTNGESFGEIYNGQTANYEGAAGNSPFTGGNSPQYNVQTSPSCATPGGTASVATTGAALNTGVNLFANPCAVFNEFRRPVLGQDMGSGGFAIRGFPFWMLDATVSKDFRVTERFGATLSFQFVNLLNHFVPADPTTSIDSPTTFGVVTNQYTTPNGAQSRSLEFGLRVRF